MRKSGFYFIEGMPANDHARPKPGTAEPENWKPYKVWSGDLYECQGCGACIISGFGQRPLSEHYRDGFEQIVKETNASQLQVNDC